MTWRGAGRAEPCCSAANLDNRNFDQVSSGKTRIRRMRCATLCSAFRCVRSGAIARRRSGLLAGDPGMATQSGDTKSAGPRARLVAIGQKPVAAI